MRASYETERGAGARVRIDAILAQLEAASRALAAEASVARSQEALRIVLALAAEVDLRAADPLVINFYRLYEHTALSITEGMTEEALDTLRVLEEGLRAIRDSAAEDDLGGTPRRRAIA